MTGNAHPIYKDNVPVDKANARAYTPLRLGNPDALRALDGSTFWLCYIQTLIAFFYRDTSDTTSADNGASIIVDGSGGIWKIISSGAGIAINAAGPVADRGGFDSEDPGFTYFGTDTSLLYVRVNGGGWSAGSSLTGPAGDPGVNGATWLSGSTDPSSGSGSNGDFYFQTGTGSSGVAGDTWKKAAGSWSKQINLKGPAGADSAVPGPANTLTIGTVTGGDTAAATITGTAPDQTLNLTLPKGDPGDDGAAATITIGTVTTGSAGSSASVINSGTSDAAVLDFTIPRGDTGASGSGTGDMLESVYDPNGKAADAFDQDNMSDGAVNKNFTATEKTKLEGIADGAEVNVQADWNVSSGDAAILNKPTIGTAAATDASAYATAAQGALADSAVQTLVEGTGVSIDNTDPKNPIINASGGGVVRGHLFGLTLSTLGSSSTFGIAAGSATDSSASALMSLASAYTKTTSSWSVGSGNGALDTGSIAANTWYHVWLIQRSDTGFVDVLISTSATAPTMPTNYDRKRRIGSMLTNGSSQWMSFAQIGDSFYWANAVNNYTGASRSDAVLAVSTPPGVVTAPIISGYITSGSGGATTQLLVGNGTAAAATLVIAGSGDSFGKSGGATSLVFTDTSAQIRMAAVGNLLSNSTTLSTVGWIDTRGRLN